MAGSKVEIVNLALMKLGTTPIATFNDDTKAGLLARTSYDQLLEQELRTHPWNFATKRATIPSATPDPVWGYDFAYDLPEEENRCLRVLEVNGEGVDTDTWRVEGRQILTNLTTPIDIRYIFREDNVQKYDACFVEALACRIAASWAESFGRDSAYAELKWKEYQAAIQTAWTIDGQEQVGAELLSTTWLDAR